MKPFLSIIIPIYNMEKYLDDCISSCLNQGVNDKIEIICVDDGSTDSSRDIVRSFLPGHNFITLISTENYGVSAARNRAIDTAVGEYVMMLDADDFVYPQSLKYICDNADLIRKNPVIMLDYVRVSESYKLRDNKLKPISRCPSTHEILGSGKVRLHEYHRDYGFSCRYLFNLEFLNNDHTRYIEGMIMAEDRAFLYFVLMQPQRLLHIRMPLFVYRIRPDSVVHLYNSVHRDKYISGKIKCVRFYEEFLKSHPDIDSKIECEMKTEMYSNLRGALMLKAQDGNLPECEGFIDELTDEGLYPRLLLNCKKPMYNQHSLTYNALTLKFPEKNYILFICRMFNLLNKRKG